jgi:predicted flap endonuclease-1-like 5' DNA nuclease
MEWWMWLLSVLVLLSLVILIILLILWARLRKEVAAKTTQEITPAVEPTEALVEGTADEKVEKAGEAVAEAATETGEAVKETMGEAEDAVTQAVAEFEGAAKEAATEMASRAPEAVNVEPPFDDLKIVEGIGPKISSVFQAAGIRTLAQLAEAQVDDLKNILAEADIRLGDPTTWPEQAGLAAKGKWDELSALQDSLKGGRRV